MCHFSGNRFHLFSGTAYQKKAVSLDPVIKSCQKGTFCQIGLLFAPIFVFWSITVYFSPIFPRIGYHLKAKILEPGKKFPSWAHSPKQLSQVPPTPGCLLHIQKILLQCSMCSLLQTNSSYVVCVTLCNTGNFHS